MSLLKSTGFLYTQKIEPVFLCVSTTCNKIRREVRQLDSEWIKKGNLLMDFLWRKSEEKVRKRSRPTPTRNEVYCNPQVDFQRAVPSNFTCVSPRQLGVTLAFYKYIATFKRDGLMHWWAARKTSSTFPTTC